MLKTVAIVGRPNVGKSALFNRLAGKNISIVHDMAGVTRDRITAQCRKGPAWFEIMDTGGIGANTEDVLTDQVQTEASIALDVADMLLFVVDIMDGVTPIDATLASCAAPPNPSFSSATRPIPLRESSTRANLPASALKTTSRSAPRMAKASTTSSR
jgi:GTP-binding protein